MSRFLGMTTLDPSHTQGGAQSPVFTKHEAARYCRVSLRTFERRVQPHLPHVPIGARIQFNKEDLDVWLENQRVGISTETPARASTRSGSCTGLGVAPSARANEILARLRARQLASTPRSSPADGPLAKK